MKNYNTALETRLRYESNQRRSLKDKVRKEIEKKIDVEKLHINYTVNHAKHIACNLKPGHMKTYKTDYINIKCLRTLKGVAYVLSSTFKKYDCIIQGLPAVEVNQNFRKSVSRIKHTTIPLTSLKRTSFPIIPVIKKKVKYTSTSRFLTNLRLKGYIIVKTFQEPDFYEIGFINNYVVVINPDGKQEVIHINKPKES
jgi:hypothetical protein